MAECSIQVTYGKMTCHSTTVFLLQNALLKLFGDHCALLPIVLRVYIIQYNIIVNKHKLNTLECQLLSLSIIRWQCTILQKVNDLLNIRILTLFTCKIKQSHK